MSITVPESVAGGVLADFVAVRHTPHYFTIDFVAILEVKPGESPTQQNVDGQVLSRVKVLPAQVFEIMKALETQLSQWEKETGA